ncbi:MAG: sigma 54-interacting transcriptional regulator [Desulfobacterales bacterium]|nr:sigma 54-interacting transcriptional regulator [Desulfobacterales bacterium]
MMYSDQIMTEHDNATDRQVLLETRERLQYALTASDEGIWDWNFDTDTGYLSPRYFEMLGYEDNEFEGTGAMWAQMIHPDDRETALETLVNLLKTKKKTYKSVYRLRTKDGDYRWILSRGIVVRCSDDGTPVRLVGTHADITEDREKDRALRQYKDNLEQEVKKQTVELRRANRQLETILNASSESIWVCDGEGVILTLNAAAEKLSNIKAADIIGRNIKFLETDGIVDRSVTMDAIKTRRQVSRLQKQHQTRRQLLVTASPVFNDDGSIAMIVVNEQDLTHLNNLRDELQQAQKATSRYREELTSLHLADLKDQGIIAESKEMHQVIETAAKLAHRKASPVLILGESGTGKGLMAQFIHNKTHGMKHPFVQINCAALPEQLLEAELFGYEKGAFTGAQDQGKIGLFEMARGGTLFLDELGDMSLAVQAKLLKALEEKEVMHLGGLRPIKIECSVVAATNLDLKEQVRLKKFRQDLFFRLNTFTITLPPLRKRPEDIFEMIMLFTEKYKKQYKVNRQLSPACISKLEAYAFPGNVRELKNLLKKAVVMGEAEILADIDTPARRQAPARPDISEIEARIADDDAGLPDFQETMMACEKLLLSQALESFDTTRSLARQLKLSQSSVVRKLRIHGLTDRLKRKAGKR